MTAPSPVSSPSSILPSQSHRTPIPTRKKLGRLKQRHISSFITYEKLRKSGSVLTQNVKNVCARVYVWWGNVITTSARLRQYQPHHPTLSPCSESLYCRHENTKSEKVFFTPEKRPEEQGRAANDV